MKKNTILLLLLFAWSFASAQIPESFYGNCSSKTSEALKIELNNLTQDHKQYPYTARTIDVWDILKEADKDPNNSENVILFYTNRSVNAAQEYNKAKGWTREHVWAKSRGDFGIEKGAGTDCHHLRACNAKVNSKRNNRLFDERANQAVWNDGKNTGCFTGGKEIYCFEPRDEIKGDVARMLFYMVVRYEGENGEVDLELNEELLSKSSKAPFHGVLSNLLKWHKEDPVSEAEIKRNEIIYKFQENRNPFIDHPEYVGLIWN
jgi:endonuclease I